MKKAQPDLSEKKMGDILTAALIESGHPSSYAAQIETDLYQSGAFEDLKAHIEREIENPTLKGPNLKWQLKHALGR